MATYGMQTEVPDTPYRQFNLGFEAGIANPVTTGEIATIVQVLATLPRL